MAIADRLPNWLAAPKPVQGSSARKVARSNSGLKSSTVAVAAPPSGTDLEEGSSTPTVIQDVVPALASAYSRLVAYTQMMTDAGVDVSVRALKTPVLGADFYVDPCSGDPNDVIVSQFIEANLFGGMDQPFGAVLEDILHFFEDGFSVVEKVHEERQWNPDAKGANGKTYTMLQRLAIRPASTISQIIYDKNGNPTQVTQSAIQGDGSTTNVTSTLVTLPIEKIVVFSFQRKSGDLTGKSILRTAYAHWYYKTHFYKIDAIQKERHGIGVPRGKLLPGYTPEDKNILRTLLRNIRTNEESFIMQTPTVEIDFAELSGNLVDVLSSAIHHNSMILLNVMAQFLSITNEGASGGKASSSSQVDIFMKSLRYVANSIICDLINTHIIPELVVWNFPTTNFPKLRVRNMGETRDLQSLASGLASLFAQSAVTPDDDTENWIRKIFDMPAKVPGAKPTGLDRNESVGGATEESGGTTPGTPGPAKGTTTGERTGNKGVTGQPD